MIIKRTFFKVVCEILPYNYETFPVTGWGIKPFSFFFHPQIFHFILHLNYASDFSVFVWGIWAVSDNITASTSELPVGCIKTQVAGLNPSVPDSVTLRWAENLHFWSALGWYQSCQSRDHTLRTTALKRLSFLFALTCCISFKYTVLRVSRYRRRNGDYSLRHPFSYWSYNSWCLSLLSREEILLISSHCLQLLPWKMLYVMIKHHQAPEGGSV